MLIKSPETWHLGIFGVTGNIKENTWIKKKMLRKSVIFEDIGREDRLIWKIGGKDY